MARELTSACNAESYSIRDAADIGQHEKPLQYTVICARACIESDTLAKITLARAGIVYRMASNYH